MKMDPFEHDELSDSELDSLLKKWEAPAAPGRLRAAVFAEEAQPWWRRAWSASFRVPLPVALGSSALLMICMSGRFVPAMAMMTAAVESRWRGGFMSVNTAVQQFACGLAAWAGGRIVGQGPNQEITHFPLVGFLSLFCVFSCIWLARFLKPAARDLAGAPVFAEPI